MTHQLSSLTTPGHARALLGVALAATLLTSAASASATTIAGGTVINQTWVAAGSPYVVEGDITVPSGAFLRIEEGVEVQLASSDSQGSGIDTGRVEISVAGEIEVVGTAADPVVFKAQTGTNRQTWYALILEDTCTKADFSWMTFSHAWQGLRSHAPGAVVSIQTSEFADNYSYGVDLYEGVGLFDRVVSRDNNNYGVTVRDGSAVLTNTILADNGSYGLYVVGGDVDVMNATIYSNSSRGVYGSAGTIDIINSVITHNPTYGIDEAGSAAITVSYSNVWSNGTDIDPNVNEGAGMLSANPLYVNPPQDLSLQSSSVCIDTGTAAGVPDHDYLNVVRPLNGDGINAAEHDMGAYEYVASPICGDAQLDGGETCDDGAGNGTYGYCKSDCSGLGEHCGDNAVNGPEACDDGNVTPGDGCDADCQIESTGSGGSGGSGTGGSGTGGSGTGGSGTGANGSGGSGTGANGSGGGGAGTPGDCVPGEQVACACPGSSDGAQVCNDEGSGYGACSCGGSGNDGDGSEDSGGCSMSTAPESPTPWAMLMLAGFGLWAGRRRRK